MQTCVFAFFWTETGFSAFFLTLRLSSSFFLSNQFHISIVIYYFVRIYIAIWRMNNIISIYKKSERKK